MEGCAGKLGFRRGRHSVRTAKWTVFGLKTGQRRDVTERTYANVATLMLNIATFQRVLLNNVATLDINVATF